MARDDSKAKRVREPRERKPSLIDVVNEIEIRRPRAEVAAYSGDMDNAPAWYEAVSSVEWKSPGPARVGSEFAMTQKILGSPVVYGYEIRELVPGERLVTSTDDGPFELVTTYEWADAGDGDGATRMTLRNRGEARRLGKFAARAVAGAMRRAGRKDLQRLKELLEQPA